MNNVAEAASAPSSAGNFWTRLTAKPWWPWVKRVVTLAFFGLIAWLLFNQARTVDWGAVWLAIQGTRRGLLLSAAGLAIASFVLYSSYDLLGRHFTGHSLSAPTVMKVTFISYAFNLNLGSLVGGVAFRYRLYARLGLDHGTTTRIVTISMVTNWLGYLLLAAVVFWFWPLALPDGWKLTGTGLQWLGLALGAVAIAYLVACVWARGRTFSVRGHAFSMPSLPVGLLQLAMSCTNWMLIAGIVWCLLGQRVDYPLVLGALLAAAVAGVITHVPAGLGVLEAVFIALLGHLVPREELLAALLTYRAVYYLAPLAIATATYLMTESRARDQTTPESKAPVPQGH